jgi:hypothetical protein
MEFRKNIEVKLTVSYARMARGLVMLALAVLVLTFVRGEARAASSRFCEGGAWVLTQQGNTMLVRGRHVQFDIDLRTMAVLNWTLTGAPNVGRLVDRPTVIFLEKTPLHGAVLTQTERLRNDKGDLVFTRTNGVVSVKIQAKDCSQGGVFQMEIERDDDLNTRVRHVLAPETFYYDNPNFRAREGDVVTFSNGAGEMQDITVTPRINFGSDTSARLVGRDSPQAATRINHATCTNSIPTRNGTFASVRHCGGVSEWDVLSGGRMGQVMGEDSTEVAPPATFCTQDCQAQNQVRGGAVVLGFPFPVPDIFRLKPRTP